MGFGHHEHEQVQRRACIAVSGKSICIVLLESVVRRDQYMLGPASKLRPEFLAKGGYALHIEDDAMSYLVSAQGNFA